MNKPTNIEMIETALSDAGCESVTIKRDHPSESFRDLVVTNFNMLLHQSEDIKGEWIKSFTVNHREYAPLEYMDLVVINKVGLPHTRGHVMNDYGDKVRVRDGDGEFLCFSRSRIVLLHRGGNDE